MPCHGTASVERSADRLASSAMSLVKKWWRGRQPQRLLSCW